MSPDLCFCGICKPGGCGCLCGSTGPRNSCFRTFTTELALVHEDGKRVLTAPFCTVCADHRLNEYNEPRYHFEPVD